MASLTDDGTPVLLGPGQQPPHGSWPPGVLRAAEHAPLPLVGGGDGGVVVCVGDGVGEGDWPGAGVCGGPDDLVFLPAPEASLFAAPVFPDDLVVDDDLEEECDDGD